MLYNMTPQKHGLGWLPDVPDQRDIIFRPAVLPKLELLPDEIDLRAACPAIYNQGQLGSCTANAIGAAFDFDRHKEGGGFMMPSRLFIYYNERDMEGTVATDAGASLRDGIKSLKTIGVAPEREWPYDIARFTEKPSAQCYTDAEKNQALQYQRITTPHDSPLSDMFACLQEGYPFVTGISVYESFESDETARTGIIPIPAPHEKLLGGHAVLVVGYRRTEEQFICRNSWGTEWGDQGYFYLPFGYLADKGLANDMWVVKTVEV